MTGIDGVAVLVPCSGAGPQMPGTRMAGPRMAETATAGNAAGATMAAGHASGGHDMPAQTANLECPFAVAALPADVPVPLAMPMPRASQVPVRSERPAVAVPGRGLAAPPPPSTGPPLLA